MVGYRPALCIWCERKLNEESKCVRPARHRVRKGYALPFSLSVDRKHLINREKVMLRCSWFKSTDLTVKLRGPIFSIERGAENAEDEGHQRGSKGVCESSIRSEV